MYYFTKFIFLLYSYFIKFIFFIFRIFEVHIHILWSSYFIELMFLWSSYFSLLLSLNKHALRCFLSPRTNNCRNNLKRLNFLSKQYILKRPEVLFSLFYYNEAATFYLNIVPLRFGRRKVSNGVDKSLMIIMSFPSSFYVCVLVSFTMCRKRQKCFARPVSKRSNVEIKQRLST